MNDKKSSPKPVVLSSSKGAPEPIDVTAGRFSVGDRSCDSVFALPFDAGEFLDTSDDGVDWCFDDEGTRDVSRLSRILVPWCAF